RRGQVGDLAEGTGWHGILCPRDFTQRHRAELRPEAQRLRRYHDGLRRQWFLLGIKIARTHLCLAVQPSLRDEHGKQKTTATAIMIMVLRRTAIFPWASP